MKRAGSGECSYQTAGDSRPGTLAARFVPRTAELEWNLQDLAVSELSRPANASSARSAAFIFSALLGESHPLVCR